MADDGVQAAGQSVRNIMRRYYAVWWTWSFAGGFLFGVYPIFLRSRGLDQFQINSVLAVYFVVLFLTDVPTGAFADALGRRRSFLVGTALRVAAFLVYFFAHHYVIFLVAETIDGIGTTFCSGAIDAWGVDALDEAGYEGIKDRLFSRISQLTNFGFMGSALIGAYVADINIAWPWLLGATGYAVAGVAGAFLMRGEKPRKVQLEVISLPAQVVSRVREGVRDGFQMRPVLILSAAGALTVAAWAPYWLEWPILFNERFAVGVWIIGWIYSGLTIARMIGAELIIRIGGDEAARPARVAMLVTAASVLLAMAGVFAGRPALALGSLFAMNICTGAMQPVLQSWFNELIPAEQRATLLSFSSTFQTMGGSGGLLLGGVVADRAGIPIGWQMAGAISLFAAPLYWMLRARGATAAVAVAQTD